jgi:biopolymer transport protein ExbD
MAELITSLGKPGRKPRVKKMPVRVDLTAMVDLAFLLITFFMLTTSLLKPREMTVNMPADGPAGPVGEKETMTICLGKNNQALWYMGMPDKPLTTPKLMGYGDEMKRTLMVNGSQVRKATGKGMIVLVKPAAHSVYNNLVETMDDLNITNVPTYAIAKISPQDIEMLKQKGIY